MSAATLQTSTSHAMLHSQQSLGRTPAGPADGTPSCPRAVPCGDAAAAGLGLSRGHLGARRISTERIGLSESRRFSGRPAERYTRAPQSEPRPPAAARRWRATKAHRLEWASLCGMRWLPWRSPGLLEAGAQPFGPLLGRFALLTRSRARVPR